MFSVPPLYAILDLEAAGARGFDSRVVFQGWLDAGVRLVQLRTKTMASGPLVALAREFANAAARANATFILNDRADLARMAGAAGVHVGQTDLRPAEARQLLGADAIVGLSTHTPEELHAAMREAVDYVAVGAVFRTSMKGPAHPTIGTEFVRQAAVLGAAHDKPIVAIGGITLETARSVLDAGASSIAVIRDLLVGDPVDRARQYLSVIGK